MSTKSNSLQSRFGFHPCSHELYLKIKHLHKRYWLTLYQFHTWYRWYRKQPQNRVGEEPQYCTAFVQETTWYKPKRLGGEDGIRIYPRKVVDYDIVALYHAARTPSSETVEPFSSEAIMRIELLYNEVIAWEKASRDHGKLEE